MNRLWSMVCLTDHLLRLRSVANLLSGSISIHLSSGIIVPYPSLYPLASMVSLAGIQLTIISWEKGSNSNLRGLPGGRDSVNGV